jgi:hypothetical protein
MDFYGVLLQFEKRMSVNIQKIDLEFMIMGRITEGAEIFNHSGNREGRKFFR